MFIDLFHGRTSIIPWFAFCEPNGRCRVLDFLNDLPEVRKAKLVGQMLSFSDLGWDSRSPFMKALQTQSPHSIYEIKRHQERVLFVRCDNTAVAVYALTKKDDWSKKDANKLGAALKLADAAIEAWKGKGK